MQQIQLFVDFRFLDRINRGELETVEAQRIECINDAVRLVTPDASTYNDIREQIAECRASSVSAFTTRLTVPPDGQADEAAGVNVS
ncbi:hypothetical protein [Rhodococcus globerulus]|uniref:hypothetical protein n=1 Tax=Rhodococcus globerulus TaxID=33008 RepID=UPI000A702F43|nr:hypothetical protein [Rhodococcus globerulus]